MRVVAQRREVFRQTLGGKAHLARWSLPGSWGCWSWRSCRCSSSSEASPWTYPASAGQGCCRNRNIFTVLLAKKGNRMNSDSEKAVRVHLARMRWAPARGPRPGPFPGEFFRTKAGEMEVVLWGTWKRTFPFIHHNSFTSRTFGWQKNN